MYFTHGSMRPFPRFQPQGLPPANLDFSLEGTSLLSLASSSQPSLSHSCGSSPRFCSKSTDLASLSAIKALENDWYLLFLLQRQSALADENYFPSFIPEGNCTNGNHVMPQTKNNKY